MADKNKPSGEGSDEAARLVPRRVVQVEDRPPDTKRSAVRKPFEAWHEEKDAERPPRERMPSESVRLACSDGKGDWPSGWPNGYEVTEQEYDAAVARVLGTPIGYTALGSSAAAKKGK